ncbi:efflux RND transporter periplasmic adaptor subunit [Alginatibacterium sediminis]|uniref:Efflux RND transporter periplasmic adaptor subunit n=1 Tax=Alginatibacterium sediminis TaxID=2164068 RepID=A0A420ELS2_9ALTE|nr:efflux RND transporter periplasmic adaptor subunit [Alginatibacterium sediminis]RKF21554.1 efflux RND transporter periplasmic adaptor subunit [Alginatibacterium sediminis]
MKKTMLALITLSALVGCAQESIEPQHQQTTITTVKVHVAQTQTAEFTEKHSGLLLPKHQVDVTSRTPGYLLKSYVNAGDKIEKGQLMYELDSLDFELEKAELEAQLAIAKTRSDMASRDHKRSQKLIGSLATQEIEEVETRFKLAQGQVQLLERQIDRVNLSIERTTIRSPIAGVVGEKSFDIGAMISSSQTLNTIVNDEQLEVVLNIDEKKLLSITDDLRQGRAEFKAKLKLIDGSILPSEGEISSIDNHVDPSTGSLAVRIEFDNNGQAYAGQYAELLVVRSETAMLVPQQAIVSDAKADYVYVVEHDKVKKVEVTLGQASAAKRVVHGLALNSKVIIEGQAKLSVDQSVTVEG